MQVTIKPILASLLLALPALAHADFQVNSMLATGSYAHSGEVANDVSSFPPTNGVDVLRFANDVNTGDTGYHSYGSIDGSFGSRSSGYGSYDVKSAFNITGTFTNTSATAQHVYFTFDITPGMLNNDVHTPFSGSQYVESGIRFSVKTNGSEVFGSNASLKTNSSGTVYQQSGTDLYTETSPTHYNINAYHQQVDLGVLNAGESLQLTYDLSTYAKGESGSLVSALVHPAQTVVVPDQTIFVPAHDEFVIVPIEGEYSYEDVVIDPVTGKELTYRCSINEERCGFGYFTSVPDQNQFIPGYTYDIAEYIEYPYGQVSGSHASSGDPFGFYGDAPYFTGQMAGTSPFQFTATAVPEPESLAMFMAGLGLMGWRIRHSTKKSSMK